MEETLGYRHLAQQRSITELKGSLEEDKIFVRLLFSKCSIWQRVRTDPVVADYTTPMKHIQFWVRFSHFENPSPRAKAIYENMVSTYLTCLRVPEDEHPFVFQKLFDAIQAAVSPVDPIIVSVWEVKHRVEDGHDEPSRPNFIPASKSAIQALEPVTVLDADACAICLEDSETTTVCSSYSWNKKVL